MQHDHETYLKMQRIRTKTLAPFTMLVNTCLATKFDPQALDSAARLVKIYRELGVVLLKYKDLHKQYTGHTRSIAEERQMLEAHVEVPNANWQRHEIMCRMMQHNSARAENKMEARELSFSIYKIRVELWKWSQEPFHKTEPLEFRYLCCDFYEELLRKVWGPTKWNQLCHKDEHPMNALPGRVVEDGRHDMMSKDIVMVFFWLNQVEARMVLMKEIQVLLGFITCVDL